TISSEVVFSVFLISYKWKLLGLGSTRSIHTAGVCVTGRRVAKGSLRTKSFFGVWWLGDTNPSAQ
ncbi:hypothetical protein, partial [Desulfosporosinus sp. OT]|uniref:hypothetical protein n=1 Tax=Desulfosporosinus sp. OT TaxID=913865 RepID=UPI001A991BD5